MICLDCIFDSCVLPFSPFVCAYVFFACACIYHNEFDRLTALSDVVCDDHCVLLLLASEAVNASDSAYTKMLVARIP